jgi:hypothetical protein
METFWAVLGMNGPQVVLVKAQGNSKAARVQLQATKIVPNAFLSIGWSEAWFRGRRIALEIEILRLVKEHSSWQWSASFEERIAARRLQSMTCAGKCIKA